MSKLQLVWLLAQLLLKVAISDWMLGVQIQHFENYNNAERMDGQYCCCDEASTCSDNMMALSYAYNCTYACQTYFVVHSTECRNALFCVYVKRFNFSGFSPYLSYIVFEIPVEESLSNDQSALWLQAWDDDSDQDNDDDIIDDFTIPLSDIAINSGQSNIHTVQGEYGIGNLTLIYYNLTTEANSHQSMDIQQVSTTAVSTSMDTTMVTTMVTTMDTTCTCIDACSSSMATITTRLDSVAAISSSRSSKIPISSNSQQSDKQATINPVCTSVVVSLLVVSVLLAGITIALGIAVCRTRKGVKSEPISNLSTHPKDVCKAETDKNNNDMNKPAVNYYAENELYNTADRGKVIYRYEEIAKESS